MARTSKYDTIQWVLQLKQYGLTEFTKSQIPQHIFNASYFRTAFTAGYIKRVRKCQSDNRHTRNVYMWEIDEDAINNAHGLKRGLTN